MKVKESEVLHYLGYKGQPADQNTLGLIQRCLAELYDLIPKQYAAYDIYDLTWENNVLELKNSIVALPGQDIARHLRFSQQVAVMAVTLGLKVEQRIAYYSKTDLARGVVMDACASAAVEELCDQLEEEIRTKAAQQGLSLTSRYSPGYGDFPLALQAQILTVLDAYRKIGLTVSDSSLLIPRKSVTAVIGLQQDAPCQADSTSKCESCNRADCPFKRG